jgi:hypothetical protein
MPTKQTVKRRIGRGEVETVFGFRGSRGTNKFYPFENQSQPDKVFDGLRNVNF